MPFRPYPGDELTIGERTYSIAEHPAAPGMAYGQSGRRGTVYKLIDQKDQAWALKVFLRQFREPRLVGQAEKIRKYLKLPGLRACERDVLTSSKYLGLIRKNRELTYSVLMPWIDGKTWFEILTAGEPIPEEMGLQMAGSLIRILLSMEERSLAHCDLSGPNVIVTDEGTIELVDLEEMYSTDLSKPEVIPGGSPGYSHKTSPEGLWNARSDRFAGAILIAEMLGWSDERVRKASWGEGYFNPDEMQTNCERYHIHERVLNERWGKDVAEYFERAWRSESLMECATFAEWMAAVPECVPGREEVSKSVKVDPVAVGGDFNQDKPELDEGAVSRIEEIETEMSTVQMDERVWICPVCKREVGILLEVCPFCEGKVQDSELTQAALGEGRHPRRRSLLTLPVVAILLTVMLIVWLGGTYLHNRAGVRGTQTAIAFVLDKTESAIETTPRNISTQTTTPSPYLTLTSSPVYLDTSDPSSTQDGESLPTGSCYRLAFVADVTIPDNTTMAAGEIFTKTWRVRNSGSCAWDIGFKFKLTYGESMEGTELTLDKAISPGEETDLSIVMTAPDDPGTYQGNWRMTTSSGAFFGDEIYVLITVGEGEAATSTPILGVGSLMISEVDGMEMVYVPAGTFLMGSTSDDPDANADEFPQHEVYLDAFWIDRTEVTNAMYAVFLNLKGNQLEDGKTWLDADDGDARIKLSGGEWQAQSGYENHPVGEVTWYGAEAYCEWAGRRLPTEAEWEKAARGDDGRTYPWGEGIDCDHAQYNACPGDTIPVGSKTSGISPYGALDMAGNVWEWVADRYYTDYYEESPRENPLGPISGGYRVLRGGLWFSPPSHVRASDRGRLNPKEAYIYAGFRCATEFPSKSIFGSPIPNTGLIGLVGIWVRTSTESCCFEKVIIREFSGEYYVRVWYTGHIQYLGEWEEQKAEISSVHTTYSPDADEYLSITWNPGGDYELLCQMSLLEDGTLEIWMHDEGSVGRQILVRE